MPRSRARPKPPAGTARSGCKRRPCLGPLDPPHLYDSSGPGDRLCAACREYRRTMSVGRLLLEPVRVHTGG